MEEEGEGVVAASLTPGQNFTNIQQGTNFEILKNQHEIRRELNIYTHVG